MIARQDITGLVLAGGRGSRMGGVDKGLQPYRGQPLALNALQRLAPQVGPLAVNANRHLDDYAALGVPVWPDTLPDHPGPLAGMLAGLAQCRTPWLVTVPCDSPHFPPDLVARLAHALAAADAEMAVVSTRAEPEDTPEGTAQATSARRQPVFCLLHTGLHDSLAAFLAAGERKVGRWMGQHRCVEVVFDEADAFVNTNTLEELQRVQGA